MSMTLVRNKTNAPLIATLWTLTFLSLILFQSVPLMILGCLCNLFSNGIAVYLLFQPSFTNRLNGGIRLVIQVIALLVGIVLFVKSGLSPFSMMQSLQNQLH